MYSVVKLSYTNKEMKYIYTQVLLCTCFTIYMPSCEFNSCGWKVCSATTMIRRRVLWRLMGLDDRSGPSIVFREHCKGHSRLLWTRHRGSRTPVKNYVTYTVVKSSIIYQTISPLQDSDDRWNVKSAGKQVPEWRLSFREAKSAKLLALPSTVFLWCKKLAPVTHARQE